MEETNPIIGGRIVSDRTFALRLCMFIRQTQVSDLLGEEEKEYLSSVARRLLKHQVETAQGDEAQYLGNNKDSIGEILGKDNA